jgi:hypothetical protein
MCPGETGRVATRMCGQPLAGKPDHMTKDNRDRSKPRDDRADDGRARAERGEIVDSPNSTVDDWLGQQVSSDEEVVDELLEETDGDVEEAERRFPERSHQDRPDRLPTEQRRT